MNNVLLNGVKTYSFSSRKELIVYVSDQKKSLIAINAEKILHASEQTRYIINRNIGYSDGIGAVWALKNKGFDKTIKIPGCELWLDLIRELHKEKSFYLVGSKQEVIDQTVYKLKEEYPSIRILDYRNGYIRSDEERISLISDIAKKKPDVIFVAMGSPKQELLIEEMQAKHKAIYMGLGGSFDVFTGNVKRAPDWWVRHNLEWAYRLIKQPARITRQLHLLKFFFLLLTRKI